MSKQEKVLEKLQQNPKSVRFEEVDVLLVHLGCNKRMKGSHATYTYPGLSPIVIPFRKPFILPIYVKKILELIDAIQETDQR